MFPIGKTKYLKGFDNQVKNWKYSARRLIGSRIIESVAYYNHKFLVP
jgi:hypothetical protein